MSSVDPVIRLLFAAPEELEREYRDNLSQGRAFTPEVHAVQPRQPARLLLTGPCAECEVAAEVVMVAEAGPVRGVGLALTDFDASARERLQLFVASAFGAATESPRASPRAAPPERDDSASIERPADTEGRRVPSPRANARLRELRDMGLPRQLKLARTAEQADRVALERMLGKSVWEALLRNPRITVGEVARIARKGTMPRPMLELIVDNVAWVKAGVVRRALLSNPKLSMDMITRVLKFAPRNEIKAMVKNPSYPHGVRSTAKRMLASAGG